mmetsp:Transcript_44243/g.147599  ORF Transcript_44243/g.147599 Transcript_44243/m.147599 type:complete len:445 (+) Transcript_44243:706-2040(+)
MSSTPNSAASAWPYRRKSRSTSPLYPVKRSLMDTSASRKQTSPQESRSGSLPSTPRSSATFPIRSVVSVEFSCSCAIAVRRGAFSGGSCSTCAQWIRMSISPLNPRPSSEGPKDRTADPRSRLSASRKVPERAPSRPTERGGMCLQWCGQVMRYFAVTTHCPSSRRERASNSAVPFRRQYTQTCTTADGSGRRSSTSSSKSHSCASPSLCPLPLLLPLPSPRACFAPRCNAREPTEVTSSVPRTLTATKGRAPRSFFRPRTAPMRSRSRLGVGGVGARHGRGKSPRHFPLAARAAQTSRSASSRTSPLMFSSPALSSKKIWARFTSNDSKTTCAGDSLPVRRSLPRKERSRVTSVSTEPALRKSLCAQCSDGGLASSTPSTCSCSRSHGPRACLALQSSTLTRSPLAAWCLAWAALEARKSTQGDRWREWMRNGYPNMPSLEMR